MRYLTVEEVIALHSRIIASSGGSLGVREPNALDSAVAQPQMTFCGVDLKVLLACSTVAHEHVLKSVSLSAITEDEAAAAIAAYSNVKTPPN